ncbi:MAG: hypothetical protein ABII79_11265 [bacterium]
MARHEQIDITTADIESIAYHNMRIGDIPVRDMQLEKPSLGLTGRFDPSSIMPWEFDDFAYQFRLSTGYEATADSSTIPSAWVERNFQRPWHLSVDWPSKIRSGQRIRVLLLPHRTMRDTNGCDQFPEYNFGYELPHLLLSEQLTLNTADRLMNVLPAIIRIMNYSCLGDSAELFALRMLMFLHLIELEGKALRFGYSPISSRRSLSNCGLTLDRLRMIASLDDEKKEKLELSLNLPSCRIEDLLQSWEEFGQRMAVSFADGIPEDESILNCEVIPPIPLSFDRIQQVMKDRGQDWEMPDISIPYKQSKLITKVMEAFQARGAGSEMATNGIEDSVIETRAASNKELSVFENRDSYWMTAFASIAVRVPDVKGMSYIHFLLGHPSEPDKSYEYHVLDLVGLVEGRPLDAVSEALSGLTREKLGEAGLDRSWLEKPERMIDRQTQREIGQCIMEIEDRLAAGNFADPTESLRLQQMLTQLKNYQKAALRFRGGTRTDASVTEKARSSVTKLINKAKEKIREYNKGLGTHLDKSLHTGIHFHYSPEYPIDWQL